MSGCVLKGFRAADAYVLSTEAGWNQTLADWERILRLAGDGSFGMEVDGRLVATAIALIYDEQLAWIGMVITAEAERGKGHARRLMQLALDHVDARGVVCTKLDATGLGRPVYAKLGFADERPVSRWRREGAGEAAKIVDPFGADRGRLLAALGETERYAVGGEGYAYARRGRLGWQFGPCVASSAACAEELLGRFLQAHGDEDAILDLFDESAEAVRLAEEAGFQPMRRLTRMLRGDLARTELAWHPNIYALAGFEYG